MFIVQLLCLSLLMNVHSFIPTINQGKISRTSTTTVILLQAVNKRGRAQNKIIELGPSNPNESDDVKSLRNKLKSEIEKSTKEFETGDELRKSRERDLKLAKIELKTVLIRKIVQLTNRTKKYGFPGLVLFSGKF